MSLDREVANGKDGGAHSCDSEKLAERITQNAETEGKADDRKAGKQRDPPGRGDEALAFGDHDAPFGDRRLDAETEIADGGAARAAPARHRTSKTRSSRQWRSAADGGT